MNNVLELFKGVGVIIDDALNPANPRKGDDIWKIKESFEKKNVPLVTYEGLPANETIQNFNSIGFLLLDWDLLGLPEEDVLQGIRKPDFSDENINFIKQFNSICFAPIFIFSKENPESIISKLIEADLYDITKSNHIFVESKSNVKQAGTLFGKIKSWIEKTPSMYVLKEWENSMYQAKHNLFWDFYHVNPMWPNILKQTFQIDGADENHELSSLIYKNLVARTTHAIFDDKILNKNTRRVTKEDLRKILECERFLKQDKLSANIPAVGDVFKDNKDYYINIRPDCDILRKGDDVRLYCLKGKIVKEQQINSKNKSKIIFNKGELLEKNYNAYIAFIDDGKIIEFKFNENNIIHEEWRNLKTKRIGRLLPPHITRLQQKYAFYLQRQGLPAIPDKAIK
ncbi:hypothetical protein Barb6_00118 [Bacteroidales bacterium Barb6]|nr:hypothetical protein Barb6_00118 [Bacteroidales bacterium Barb6]